MAIDLNKYLDYIVPQPGYIGKLEQAGLLTADDLAKARQQSLIQGLLGAGLSYLAQPKNQGYGSFVPYAAKAAQTGLQFAASPYDKLKEEAMMKQKLDAYKNEQDAKKARANLYTTIGGETITDNLPYDVVSGGQSKITTPSGEVSPYPNYNTQQISYQTPSQRVLDPQKLAEFEAKFPEQAAKLYEMEQAKANIGKTRAETEKLLAPEPVDYGAAYKTWQGMVASGDTGDFKSFNDFVTWSESQKRTDVKVNMNNPVNRLLDSGYKQLEKTSELISGQQQRLDQLYRFKTYLDTDQVLMGVGTDKKIWLARFMNIAGIGGKNTEEKLANTKELIQAMANRQLDAGSKLKGMPSDKEQVLLQKAAGADYDNLTTAELKRVIEIAILDEQYLANRHNGIIDSLSDAEKMNPNATQPMIEMLNSQKVTLPNKKVFVNF